MRPQEADFATPPPPSLHCPICQEVFMDPVITRPCSHSFCAHCFYQSVETRVPPACPLCRAAFPASDPSSGAANEITQHQSTCLFHAMLPYLTAQEGRVAALEDRLLRQQRELDRLREFVRTAKTHPQVQVSPMQSPIQPMGVDDGDSAPLSITDDENRPVVTQSAVSSSATSGHTGWSLGPVECLETWRPSSAGITALALSSSADSSLLFCGSYDGTVTVLDRSTTSGPSSDEDYATGAHVVRGSFVAHQNTVWCLACDPEQRRVFSGSSDQHVKVWERDPVSGELQATMQLDEHRGKIYSLVYDNHHLFSASSDRLIKVWGPDWTDSASKASWMGHRDNVNGITMMHDHLASASSDRTVRLWDVERGTCVHCFPESDSEVLDVVFGGGTRNLLFASTYDASILCIDVRTRKRVATLLGHNWEVWQLEADDDVVWSGSFDHTIKRWDIRQLSCLGTLRGHRGYVHALVRDQRHLFSGCADRTVREWGAPVTDQGHADLVSS